jgi:hypothetical protein
LCVSVLDDSIYMRYLEELNSERHKRELERGVARSRGQGMRS